MTTVPETTADLLARDSGGECIFTEMLFSRNDETVLKTEISSCNFH